MGKGFLSLATATILNAVSNGYSFGFDIVDITGMPGGTVYPALRRLEDAGYLTSKWEKERVAQAELRPRRKYYESDARRPRGAGRGRETLPAPRAGAARTCASRSRLAPEMPVSLTSRWRRVCPGPISG